MEATLPGSDVFLRFANLKSDLQVLRASGETVRITGLAAFASIFPPELTEIVFAGRPESLPVTGLGGVAITVIEASLLDMEAGFRLDSGDPARARELIDQLESKALGGAGTYFSILAAFADCRLSQQVGQVDRALKRCQTALGLFEDLEPPGSAPQEMHETLKQQIFLQLAQLHAHQGDFGKVEQLQAQAEPHISSADPCSKAKLEVERGITKIRLGSFAEAKTLFVAGSEALAKIGGCGGLEAQAVGLLSAAEVALGELGGAQLHARKPFDSLPRATMDG